MAKTKNKTKYQSPSSLNALTTKYNNTDFSDCTKMCVAKKLTKILLLEEECHRHKNRAYILPKDFRYIYTTYLNLKEKSDEQYKKVHSVFFRVLKKQWEKVEFFDISNMLAILLSTASYMPEDLKVHLQEIRKLLLNLDCLYLRYPNLYFSIFSRKKTEEQNAKKEKLTENSLKEEILLSLCVFDKKDYKYKNDIDYITRKTNKILETPYIA